jgi:hypothetical protein
MFWDEKDGPNVDSNASAEGICATPTGGPRGERGIFDRGLFDKVEAVEAAAASCHSFDFAALIPDLRLDP